MFAIENKKEQGFEKIILHDKNNNTVVEIIPSCGAILHSFSVEHNNRLLNVIDNYDNKDDFTNNVASKGFKSCKLSPFACRVKNARYQFGGRSYNIEKFLLNEHALHGLLYDAVFTIVSQYADESEAMVILSYQYHGDEKGFPFQYDCIITYHLQKANTLSIRTEIINNSNGLMPIQDGWHPYFTFGDNIDELQLEFQSNEKVEMDKDIIPTGKLLPYHEFTSLKKIGNSSFDDCFTLNFAECQPLLVLRDTEKKIQLEMYPSKSYPYLQLYTPPHRKSIAVENLSAAPDAFNNAMGLITLAAGDKINFNTTYKLTSLI